LANGRLPRASDGQYLDLILQDFTYDSVALFQDLSKILVLEFWNDSTGMWEVSNLSQPSQ
jgi:hypothetical protein